MYENKLARTAFSSRIPELLCMAEGRCRRFIPAKNSYGQARQEPSNTNTCRIWSSLNAEYKTKNTQQGDGDLEEVPGAILDTL